MDTMSISVSIDSARALRKSYLNADIQCRKEIDKNKKDRNNNDSLTCFISKQEIIITNKIIILQCAYKIGISGIS